jgi:hypothetical protein
MYLCNSTICKWEWGGEVEWPIIMKKERGGGDDGSY